MMSKKEAVEEKPPVLAEGGGGAAPTHSIPAARLECKPADAAGHVIARLHGVKNCGTDRWTALCPAHPDHNASLSIRRQDGKALLHCHAGCTISDVLRALGMEKRDLFSRLASDRSTPPPARPKSKPKAKVVEEYNYYDADGKLLSQALRYEPKDFRQRRPDGRGGWVWNLDGVPRVLYRLPELLTADPDELVFVVEGERDTDRLVALGLVATTNCGGGGKWSGLADDSALHGRRVAIIPDQDAPGRKHAQDVAGHLHGKAREVKVVELPPGQPGWDVSDWMAQDEDKGGGNVQRLLALVDEAPPWEESPDCEAAGDDAQVDLLKDCTDAGNAELLARLHGDTLRYDHKRSRWLVWAEHWWRDDSDGEPARLVLDAARWRAGRAYDFLDAEAAKYAFKWAIASRQSNRVTAALKMAESTRPIADAGENWDAVPLLLAVANGVVDLETGELRDGRPDDRITQHTPVDFDPDAQCPRWELFLEQIFDGDADLVEHIHRAVGYSLTGDVREQVWWLLCGEGQNGKGVFLATLRHVFGEFAHNTGFSTFEYQKFAGIPEDLALLACKRFVTASETGEGSRLNEARIKAVTGGDRQTARFLHGHFFEFEPTAKLWLAVNNLPQVKDNSHAFWRRVRLIPFDRKFENEGDDKELRDKLLVELPGILAWAVRGCAKWRKDGLTLPDVVASATRAYSSENDPLAVFLDEGCDLGKGLEATSAALYAAFCGWSSNEGITEREQLTRQAFGRAMSKRFKMVRIGHPRRTRCYLGVAPRTAPDTT